MSHIKKPVMLPYDALRCHKHSLLENRVYADIVNTELSGAATQ